MWRVSALALLALVAAGCGGGKHVAKTTPHPRAAIRPAVFRASLSAPTHRPRVGPRWWYVVHAVDLLGRPLRARLTVQVVDPLGTAHAAQVGTTTKKLLNFPFTARYRDFVQWPAASRSFRLTFRAIVNARGSSRTLTYWIRPR
jgi:hypothetical protein